LIDVRNQLDRYTTPETVEWHFASINNRWTKRALAAAGFGFIETPSEDGLAHHVKSIFSVAEIGGSDSAANAADYDEIAKAKAAHKGTDIETGGYNTEDKREDQKVKLAAIHGLNLPLFHLDLTEALASAVSNTQARDATAKKIAEVEGRETPDDNIIR
jgi:sodium-independent sulfate anion transporter 11